MVEAMETIKEQVLQTGRLIAAGGLVVGTWGNISARVPGQRRFVVTPSGMPYHRLTRADLVVVDDSGAIIEGRRRPSTELKLHLAIYRARADAGAVVHTHSVFASALGVAGRELPPILEDQVQLVGGAVPLARYALAGTDELAAAAVQALGDVNAVLLANHGLVGLGRDVQEAYQVCLVVEKAAQVYAWASMLGRAQPIPREEVQVLRQLFLHSYGQTEGE